MLKDLVVVATARSAWLWVCKSVLVVVVIGLLIGFVCGSGVEFRWWIWCVVGLLSRSSDDDHGGSMWWAAGRGGSRVEFR